MELRRTLTGGLAWAGLVIVVAVPTVEAVRSKLVPDGAGAAQTVAEIEPPVVSPPVAVPMVVAPVASPAVANKAAAIVVAPIPHVISAPVATASTHVSPTPAITSPIVNQASVANVAATPTPEVPKAAPSKSSPLPKTAVATTAPVVTAAAATDSGNDSALDQYLATGKPLPSYIKASPTPASVASTATPPGDTLQAAPKPSMPTETEMAKLDDAGGVIQSTDTPSTEAPSAAIPPPLPMPVAARPKAPPQRLVTEADLKGWKTGSLADYLRQRGLLSSTDTGDGSSN
jgi:hypothetical protein